MRHDVHGPAADPHLGGLMSRPSTGHLASREGLHPEHRRLPQRPPVVARLLLPRLAADLPDPTQVLIPVRPGAGPVAMTTDLRIPPRRDHRSGAPLPERVVDAPLIVS